jgi:hypothetical protein
VVWLSAPGGGGVNPDVHASDEEERIRAQFVAYLEELRKIQHELDRLNKENPIKKFGYEGQREIKQLKEEYIKLQAQIKSTNFSTDQLDRLNNVANKLQNSFNQFDKDARSLSTALQMFSTAANNVSTTVTGLNTVFQSGLNVLYGYAQQQLAVYNAAIDQISATNQLAQANALYNLTVQRFGMGSTQQVAAYSALKYAQLGQVSAIQNLNQQWLSLQYAPVQALGGMLTGFGQVANSLNTLMDALFGFASILTTVLGTLTGFISGLFQMGGAATQVAGTMGGLGGAFSGFMGGGGGGYGGYGGYGGGGIGGIGGGLGASLFSALGISLAGLNLPNIVSSLSSSIGSIVGSGLSTVANIIDSSLQSVIMPGLLQQPQIATQGIQMPTAGQTVQTIQQQEQQTYGVQLYGLGNILTQALPQAITQGAPTLIALGLPFLIGKILGMLFGGRGGFGGGGGGFGGGYGVPPVIPPCLPLCAPIPPVPIKAPIPLPVAIPIPLPLAVPVPLPVAIPPLGLPVAIPPLGVPLAIPPLGIPLAIPASGIPIQTPLPEISVNTTNVEQAASDLDKTITRLENVSFDMSKAVQTVVIDTTGATQIITDLAAATNGLASAANNLGNEAVTAANSINVATADMGKGIDDAIEASSKETANIGQYIAGATGAANEISIALGDIGIASSKLASVMGDSIAATTNMATVLYDATSATDRLGGALGGIPPATNNLGNAVGGLTGALSDTGSWFSRLSPILDALGKIAIPLQVGLGAYNIYTQYTGKGAIYQATNLVQQTPNVATILNLLGTAFTTFMGATQTLLNPQAIQSFEQFLATTSPGPVTIRGVQYPANPAYYQGFQRLGGAAIDMNNYQQAIVYVNQQLQQGQITQQQYNAVINAFAQILAGTGIDVIGFSNQIQALDSAMNQLQQGVPLSNQDFTTLQNTLQQLNQTGIISDSTYNQLIQSITQTQQALLANAGWKNLINNIQLSSDEAAALQQRFTYLYNSGQITAAQFEQFETILQAETSGAVTTTSAFTDLNNGLINLANNMPLTGDQAQILTTYFTNLANAGIISYQALAQLLAIIQQLNQQQPPPGPGAPSSGAGTGTTGGGRSVATGWFLAQSGAVLVGERGPELILGTQATKALTSAQDNLISKIISGNVDALLPRQPERPPIMVMPLPILPIRESPEQPSINLPRQPERPTLLPLSITPKREEPPPEQPPINLPPVTINVNVSQDIDLIKLRTEIQNTIMNVFKTVLRTRGAY